MRGGARPQCCDQRGEHLVQDQRVLQEPRADVRGGRWPKPRHLPRSHRAAEGRERPDRDLETVAPPVGEPAQARPLPWLAARLAELGEAAVRLLLAGAVEVEPVQLVGRGVAGDAEVGEEPVVAEGADVAGWPGHRACRAATGGAALQAFGASKPGSLSRSSRLRWKSRCSRYSYRPRPSAFRSASRRAVAATGRPNQVRTPSRCRLTCAVRSEPRAAASSFRKMTSSRGIRKVCISFSVVENGSAAGGLGLVGIGLPDVLRLYLRNSRSRRRSRWVLLPSTTSHAPPPVRRRHLPLERPPTSQA